MVVGIWVGGYWSEWRVMCDRIPDFQVGTEYNRTKYILNIMFISYY